MPVVTKLRVVSSKTGHTRLSSLLRFVGQWLVLGVGGLSIPLLAGKPWSPVTLIVTAVLTAVTLLTSAALRNIEKWRRQAAFGQEPQTIPILAHALVMAIPSMEQNALFNAEWQADEEFDRRVRERRRLAKTNVQKDVMMSQPSLAAAGPFTLTPALDSAHTSAQPSDQRIYLEHLNSRVH
jgi:hypothetical protein